MSDKKLLRLLLLIGGFCFCVTIFLHIHLENELDSLNIFHGSNEDNVFSNHKIHDISHKKRTSIQQQVQTQTQTQPKLNSSNHEKDEIIENKMSNDKEIKKDDLNKDKQPIEKNDSNGKERIIQILQQSGVDVTPEIEEKIPTWTEVQSLYGSKPKIIGLDTCPKFRSTVPETDAYIGPSGTFNTGTNLLADLLLKYCTLPKRQVSKEREMKFGAQNRMHSGMLWHVPWGKHNPISWRTKHMAAVGSHGVEQTHVLPVVTIKDPYHWMGSMCRHSYAASWPHGRKAGCPNLVLSDGKPTKVEVGYRPNNKGMYESLVGMWNDWYGDYLAIDEFPRLIVRFEDLLFHLEDVLTEVCECGGGTLINHEDGIVLNEKNAKENHNNGSNGLLGAILRYGHDDLRTEHFTEEDINYAKKALNKDMMELFGYKYPKE